MSEWEPYRTWKWNTTLFAKKQTWRLILALLWWQSLRLRNEYTRCQNDARLLGKTAPTWNDWIADKLFSEKRRLTND